MWNYKRHFILRQSQEKYLANAKNFYLAFVDLKTDFDRVAGKDVWWTLRKPGLEEWLVEIAQPMKLMLKLMFEVVLESAALSVMIPWFS